MDISVGNIILYRAHINEDRRGFLVDWDLSWEEGTPNPHTKHSNSVSPPYSHCVLDQNCSVTSYRRRGNSPLSTCS